MNILMALLLSISSNLDNIIFGIGYGASNITIPIKSASIISGITACVTAVFMILGTVLGELLNVAIANVVGGVLLIAIGIYFLVSEVITSKKEECEVKDVISLKSIILIALNLSVNNIPIALAGGISNTSVLYTSLFSYIFGALFIFLGNMVGKKFKGKILPLVASILLVILGIIKCV